MWKRFVDDTFVVIKAAHIQEFLDHINSIDHHIQFTSEDSRTDGPIAFLDISVTPRMMAGSAQQSTGSLLIQIYICNGIAITTSHQNIVW